DHVDPGHLIAIGEDSHEPGCPMVKDDVLRQVHIMAEPGQLPARKNEAVVGGRRYLDPPCMRNDETVIQKDPHRARPYRRTATTSAIPIRRPPLLSRKPSWCF